MNLCGVSCNRLPIAAANVGKENIVYDLGSGDGRIVIRAAGKVECRSVGMEIDRDLFDLSEKKTKEAKLEGLVTIKRGAPLPARCENSWNGKLYGFRDRRQKQDA